MSEPPAAQIAVEEAERRVAARAAGYGAERIPLDAAAGRFLAEPVRADRPQPPFDRVTMDGVAIRFADWEAGLRRFAVRGVHAAGAPPPALSESGGCFEVMTGAVMPTGADAVVPVERIVLEGGVAAIQDDVAVRPGLNVHAAGSDCPSGAVWVPSGARLNGPRIALAASAGYETVSVARPPRTAIVSTGDELVDVGAAVAPHQIRRSNGHGCAAALVAHTGVTASLHHAPDDLAKTAAVLEAALALNDLVVLSGGVSMGRYDYVPAALAQLGVTPIFHKVAQRPGKPMWFGAGPGGQAVFGLPGNPVSTLTCLARYVIPFVFRAMAADTGPPVRAALAREVAFQPDLTYFLPVRLEWDPTGRLLAHPNPANTSGDHGALAPADGFLELPRGQDVFPAGFVGSFHPW